MPHIDDNLHINPPFVDKEAEPSMPFLWWGLRLCDPSAHNEIVGGALWSGVQYLKPHLGAYRRRSEIAGLMRDQGVTFAVGLFNAGFDALTNTLTFNTAGLVKTTVEAIAKIDKQRMAVRELHDLKVAPAAVSGRAEADLQTALIADLSLLAKNPPVELSAVPLILVVDDAQWLSQDPSLLQMLTALLRQARAESWPLLIVMTSWEREWHAHLAPGQPLSIMSPDTGDQILWLGRVKEQREIVLHALPGLTPGQAELAERRADGNPRLLGELLDYLIANPRLFAGRDLQGPLSASGEAMLQSYDLRHLAADRLRQSPEAVQNAVATASLQGLTFSTKLVDEVARAIPSLQSSDLAGAERPYSFVSLECGGRGEFRHRSYYEAADDHLSNLVDPSTARSAFEAAVASLFDGLADQLTEAPVAELVACSNSHSPGIALTALSEMARRELARKDLHAAGGIAKRALPLLKGYPEAVAVASALSLVEAHYINWGAAELDEVTSAILTHAEADMLERGNAAALHLLQAALARRANVVEVVLGPAAAEPYYAEGLRRCRDLHRDHPSATSYTDLCCACVRMGNINNSLDKPGSARALFDEAYVLAREMAVHLGEEAARPMLALAASSLASATESERGAAAARELYRLAAEASAGKTGMRSALEWRGHALRVARLARATAAGGDVAGARALYEEAIELLEGLDLATAEEAASTADVEAIRREKDLL